MGHSQNKCEICGITGIILDTHHIQSRSKGGADKGWNKCRICPNCHRKVHEGDIIIEGRYFTTGCGIGETELIYHKRGDGSITGNRDPEVWRTRK